VKPCFAAATTTLPPPCAAGCDLSASQVVCGADGLTYAHACLALCQGIAVAATGPCSNLGLSFIDLTGGAGAGAGGGGAEGEGAASAATGSASGTSALGPMPEWDGGDAGGTVAPPASRRGRLLQQTSTSTAATTSTALSFWRSYLSLMLQRWQRAQAPSGAAVPATPNGTGGQQWVAQALQQWQQQWHPQSAQASQRWQQWLTRAQAWEQRDPRWAAQVQAWQRLREQQQAGAGSTDATGAAPAPPHATTTAGATPSSGGSRPGSVSLGALMRFSSDGFRCTMRACACSTIATMMQ
jgi:hypothetical protein